jgi:hypothetical protein
MSMTSNELTSSARSVADERSPGLQPEMKPILQRLSILKTRYDCEMARLLCEPMAKAERDWLLRRLKEQHRRAREPFARQLAELHNEATIRSCR